MAGNTLLTLSGVGFAAPHSAISNAPYFGPVTPRVTSRSHTRAGRSVRPQAAEEPRGVTSRTSIQRGVAGSRELHTRTALHTEPLESHVALMHNANGCSHAPRAPQLRDEKAASLGA